MDEEVMAQILNDYDKRIALIQSQTENNSKEIERHSKEINELRSFINTTNARMDIWGARLSTAVISVKIFIWLCGLPAAAIYMVWILINIMKTVK